MEGRESVTLAINWRMLRSKAIDLQWDVSNLASGPARIGRDTTRPSSPAGTRSLSSTHDPSNSCFVQCLSFVGASTRERAHSSASTTHHNMSYTDPRQFWLLESSRNERIQAAVNQWRMEGEWRPSARPWMPPSSPDVTSGDLKINALSASKSASSRPPTMPFSLRGKAAASDGALRGKWAVWVELEATRTARRTVVGMTPNFATYAGLVC